MVNQDMKNAWAVYPGSFIQQSYAESEDHGFLLWELGTSKHDINVEFVQLPNPIPYVTVDWRGSAEATLKHVSLTCKRGSRFRVYNELPLPQKDVIAITSLLRDVMQASEVTFKTAQQANTNLVSSGTVSVPKEDLRNVDVVCRMLNEHCGGSIDDIRDNARALVERYVQHAAVDDTPRNIKWSLRHMKFDNTFAYGEGNSISFDKLSGIVGVFGPNRTGKSSIIGTMMYAMFNGTDRGSVKNLHVINVRKQNCSTRCVVNVDGNDYVIERQTKKTETKKGQVTAATALSLYKIEGDTAIDLVGEQRSDTEKAIRRLLGAPEDFLMTSLSAQDELKLFITNGSTRRKQVLSRFLDLDLFDRMHDLAKAEFNLLKSTFKNLHDKDWDSLISSCSRSIEDETSSIEACSKEVARLQHELTQLRVAETALANIPLVSAADVEDIRRQHVIASDALHSVLEHQAALNEQIAKNEARLQRMKSLLAEHDITTMKRKQSELRALERSALGFKHELSKRVAVLSQQRKSLKLLDDVPCGDSYPTCMFIRDAHSSKRLLIDQLRSVEEASADLKRVEEKAASLLNEGVNDAVSKLEQLHSACTALDIDVSKKRVEQAKTASRIEAMTLDVAKKQRQLEEASAAAVNTDISKHVALVGAIRDADTSIKLLDRKKLEHASELGKHRAAMERHLADMEDREKLKHKMRLHELVTNAFSRKGIPSNVMRSQLPLINSEISAILSGIVDFSIELESDDDSDTMEVYINYGDSRRLIELGSGMEKMISSVAIRVALVNVSSLPKTDMFILDEGFGALDDAGVEACNRLLMSLKRYFKTIIVMTHVDGVKDAADHVIEVMKVEKDAYVSYR